MLPARAARLAELHGTVLASFSTICLEAELDIVAQLLTLPQAAVCNMPPEGAPASKLLSSGRQAASYGCRVLQHTGEQLGLTEEAAALAGSTGCILHIQRCAYTGPVHAMLLHACWHRQVDMPATVDSVPALATRGCHHSRMSNSLLLLVQVISYKRSVCHFWRPLLTIALFESSHQSC